jgi:methenyltetrahydromethanopterin cyclohydrolase
MDFYKIDPMLFSPAQVVISNRQTGAVFEAGQLNAALLSQSFSE